MSLKKTHVIAIIGTFLLSFLCHFAYTLFPNVLFSILFPVNESIWEHMKILYTSIILYGIINWFILKKFNYKANNFYFSLFIMSFSSIIIYLIMFLPIYYKIGDNMFIAILLMLIVYIIVYIIGYYIINLREVGFKKVGVFFLILGYVLFTFLTYKPIKTHLFFDSLHEIYGIQK